MTDQDCARLCMDIYGRSLSVGFDYASPRSNADVWAYKVVDGVTYIVLEGTKDPLGWMLNFLALPIHPTIAHTALGPVHAGFFAGIPELCADVLRLTTGPRVITAHSRGAARAQLLAGLLVASEQSPASCVLFAPPRAGMEPLRKLLAPLPIRSYWNGGQMVWDPVPGVPLWIPGIAEYVHVRELIDVDIRPNDPLNPACWHDMALYLKAAPATVVKA